MEAGRGLRPAGEDEALQRLERLVDLVAQLLEPLDLPRRHPQALALVVQRHREVGAQIEEIVLHLLEPGTELGGEVAGEHETEDRVELVDGAVRLDPLIGLGHAAPIAETRLPRVSGSGVDPRQPYGLVPASRHGGEYRARPRRLRAGARDLHGLVHVQEREIHADRELLALELHALVDQHPERQAARLGEEDDDARVREGGVDAQVLGQARHDAGLERARVEDARDLCGQLAVDGVTLLDVDVLDEGEDVELLRAGLHPGRHGHRLPAAAGLHPEAVRRATTLISEKPGRSSARMVISIAPACWSMETCMSTATWPSGVFIVMVPPSA